jgi:hypothetical protein
MPASLQKLSDNRKIKPNNERLIECPYCPKQYLFAWDETEWNSAKGWIRLAETAVRKSHRAHGEIALPPTLKVQPKT